MSHVLLLPSLTEFARMTVDGGYLVSLSSVCLLQYLLHINCLTSERREHMKTRAALNGLENQFAETRRDWSVAAVENEILREFLERPAPAEMIQTMLQHLVPDETRGWAVYITLRPDPHIIHLRGLTETPPDTVDLNDDNLLPVWSGYPVTLRDPRVAKSRFLLNFSSADRKRVSQLYVLPVQRGERSYGLLVTSSLFPEQVPSEQRLELCRRLCLGMGRHLESSDAQADQQDESRNNTDRLAVRTVFEQQYDSPLQMAQQFLKTMQMRLDADRGAFLLSSPGEGWDSDGVISSGTLTSSNITADWRRDEEKLVTMSNGWSERVLFDDYALQAMRLNAVIQAALVLPVIVNSRLFGTLCFTRATREPFTSAQQQFVCWASTLFADKLTAASQLAEVRRLAQLDPVTQIANRHTFDENLDRELQIASATNSELSLILLDVDGFTSLNETFGQAAGDEVLRTIGQILRDALSHLRAGDRAVSARMGGDEFGVILPGMGPLGAARIAELIRKHARQVKVVWDNKPLVLTLSGGLATFPDNGTTSAALMSAAETALSNAQGSCRDTIGWPEPNTSNGATAAPSTTVAKPQAEGQSVPIAAAAASQSSRGESA